MATGRESKASKIRQSEDNEHSRVLASAALGPSTNAAAVAMEYGKPFGDLNVLDLADMLEGFNQEVAAGDMRRVEAMLVTQAYALQSIFMNFSRRALCQEYQKNLESFLRMALKAQNQCRMTLETLANIKNPPVVYARQANIANGPQQVNNGISDASRVREEKTNSSNELLEHQHGERLDSTKKGEASRADSAMAAVGSIDRPENC